MYMPGYVESAMHEHQHKIPTRPQHAPHKWEQLDYGDKTKWASPPEDRKYIHKVVVDLLYYTRVVDPTILVALVTLSVTQ